MTEWLQRTMAALWNSVRDTCVVRSLWGESGKRRYDQGTADTQRQVRGAFIEAKCHSWEKVLLQADKVVPYNLKRFYVFI